MESQRLKTNKWLEFHGEEENLKSPTLKYHAFRNPQQQHNPPRDSLRKSFKQDESKAMAKICGFGKSEWMEFQLFEINFILY